MKNLTKAQITKYLENECAFRDYEFRDAKRFGKLSVARSINLLNPSEVDLNDAVHRFSRDGFGTIVIYLDGIGNKALKPKRIKKVFSSSSQVFHLWANQSQASARQGGRISRAFFEGESCYSYGRHYEAGRIVTYKGIKVGIVNSRSYSHTTSKHTCSAYGALDGLMLRMRASTFDVREALIENQSRLIDELMSKFSRLSFHSEYTVMGDSWIANEIKEFNTLATKLGHKELCLNVPREFVSLIQSHIDYRIQRAAELGDPALVEARQAKREAAEAKKNACALEAWKLGGPDTRYIHNLRPMLIRINGDSVQTSGGATVSLDEAKQALWLIERGEAQSGIPVGSFTLNSVQGDIVKIGCHTFSLTEAAKVLKAGKAKLQLIPQFKEAIKA